MNIYIQKYEMLIVLIANRMNASMVAGRQTEKRPGLENRGHKSAQYLRLYFYLLWKRLIVNLNQHECLAT
jgi:hypothetical protein